jgi:hypothetical protein
VFLDSACKNISKTNMTNYIWVELVAVQPKGKVCSCLTVGIAGSNPAEGMNVRLVCLLRVV